jgi:vacuolar-type H+-ATPase subunit H
MVRISNKLEPEVDEAEQIFHEYRQGISQAIDKVRAKLFDQAKQEAGEIVAKADSEAIDIAKTAQHKADAVLTQARGMAEKIIKDAEKKVEKEARNKTQKEQERIITEAKAQSDRLIAATRQVCEKISKEILGKAREKADILIKQLTADSKLEADALIKSASEIKNRAEIEANLMKKKTEEETEHLIHVTQEKARSDVQKESVTVIEKTHQKVEDLLKNAREQATEERGNLIAEFVGEATKLAEFKKIKILSEAKSKAEYIAREIKGRLNSEMEKSSLLISGAQERLTDITTEISNQIAKEQFDIDTSANAEIPAEEVDADFTEEVEEKMFFAKTKDEEREYEGKLELTILAPVDIQHEKDFEKLLTEVPDLHIIVNAGASDGSNWLEMELDQPIPLVSMLKQMPPVKKVASYGNNIIVALKPS